MFDTLLEQINAAFMAAVCGFAVWKGDLHARTLGIVIFIGWLASALAHDYAPENAPLYVVLAVDVMLLLLLGGLSYVSPRVWPIVATVLQALGLVGHVSYVFEMNVQPIYYQWALALSAYGVVLALLFGTAQSWLERRALSVGSNRAKALAIAD